MTEAGSRAALALLLILLIGAVSLLPVADWVAVSVSWGREHPVAGPLVYIFLVAVATVLFLPGSVAMMIGGFVFGLLPGLLFAAIAIPLGAHSAFEFGRRVFRPWVRRRMANHQRLRMIEDALGEQPFLIVFLTRISLIIPFNFLNYAYGTTSVNARTYLAATAVGMLPAIALYVYLGTLAHDLGQILSGQAAPSELGYWLLGAGLIAIATALWVVHRAATRVLERHLKDSHVLESTE